MSGRQRYESPGTPLPPHNIDAEKALIGAILLNNDAYRRVAQIVEADHFFEQVHVEIWMTMSAMIAKGQAATPITLKGYLGDEIPGESITVLAYLAHLCTEVTAVSNVVEYAKVVRDMALCREIMRTCATISKMAAAPPVDATAESIYASLERGLEGLRPKVTTEDTDFQSFDAISMEEVYKAHRENRGLVGLSTGLPRLDQALGGLQPSDLIIIGGRPAMGKTALATGIGVAVAHHVRAVRERGEKLGPVGVFSLEMSSAQLKQRILAGIAGVSSRKIRRGDATNEEITAFAEAEHELRNLPLYIDKTGGLSIEQVKLRARSFKKKRGGISLLIIDYLQLLSGSDKKDRRVDEVTEITTGLKALAKELDIPIIALSQLSRKIEERDDKRPQLSDLRESGSIEQDADVVIFVYREEYYLRNARPKDGGDAEAVWFGKMQRWKGVAEAIIAKNRHDDPTTVEIGFEGHHVRFVNEPEWRSPDPEDARKTAKRIVLSPHGKALKELLHELAISIGRRPTREDLAHKPGLPPSAMLIDREEVKKLFFERVVVDLNEAEQRKKLHSAADNLRNADLTVNYTDPNSRNWIYLVELIAE